MARGLGVVLGLGLACGPAVPSGTDSEGGSTGGASTGESSSGGAATATGASTGPTTGPEPGGMDMGDGLAEHGPCPNGDECAQCVQTEDGSVCGPGCHEYGPGPAPGRCPPSPVQGQSICPWDEDTPGVCLLMCEVDADCPAQGMRCVACPETFAAACEALWGFTELGPRMCVWP